MNIVFMLLITASFYAFYNVCIKASSDIMHPLLGMLFLQAGAIFIGLFALAYVAFSGHIPHVFPAKGVWLAVLAGVFVCFAETMTFIVFSKGVPASLGIPVIIGGSVVGGSILGAIFLKEHLNIPQIVAIALIVSGIALLTSQKTA